jgi:hypothetical protein
MGDTKRIVSTRTLILHHTEAVEQSSMDQPPLHHPQTLRPSSSCVLSSRLGILLARNLVAIIFGNGRRMELVDRPEENVAVDRGMLRLRNRHPRDFFPWPEYRNERFRLADIHQGDWVGIAQ